MESYSELNYVVHMFIVGFETLKHFQNLKKNVFDMLLRVSLGCLTITYVDACISLQHVSIDFFNSIFSDATSNNRILSVHLQVSCTALMVCHKRFF